MWMSASDNEIAMVARLVFGRFSRQKSALVFELVKQCEAKMS